MPPSLPWDGESGEKGLDEIMLFISTDDHLHTKVKDCTDALTQLKRRLHQSKLMPVNVLCVDASDTCCDDTLRC